MGDDTQCPECDSDNTRFNCDTDMYDCRDCGTEFLVESVDVPEMQELDFND